MTTTTKPIARLSLNEANWPRGKIVAPNLASILEAIRLGEKMPPIVVTQKFVVVDGWHRITAYEKLFGPDYEVEVDIRTYRNKEQILADAIALNVGRGADLTAWDITRCVLLAEEAGMSVDTLAKLLKWRPERLTKYRDSKMGRTLDDRKLALKRSLRHKLHEPLNPVQEAANEQLSGMAPMFHVNQLVTLLETDLLPDDAHLAARLADLAELIAVWLAGRDIPETA